MAQSTQARLIGYRLNLWEDERDGAYFDRTDTKLLEQYCGNITLGRIKEQLGIGALAALKEMPRRCSRRIWFGLITRKIAIETGRALKHLNERFDTDLFNSQVLLWPGEEDAPRIGELPGARDEVLRLRKEIVTNTLGQNYEDAVHVLDRMLLPLFESATELRLKYDPEYSDQSLDYDAENGEKVRNNIINDLAETGCPHVRLIRASADGERNKQDMSLFMNYLGTHHPALLEDKRALRAVKIAFHTNQGRIRDFFVQGTVQSNAAAIDGQIDKAARDERRYSDRLIAIRLHQTLAILQRRGYLELARKLAYPDPA
jgi:hypothetical protein